MAGAISAIASSIAGSAAGLPGSSSPASRSPRRATANIPNGATSAR